MIGQMVQHHGVWWIDRVCPRQELNAVLYGLRRLCVELEDGQPDESPDAVGVEFQGPHEGVPGLLGFTQFHQAEADSVPHAGRAVGFDTEDFLVVCQSSLVVLLAVQDAGFANECWNVVLRLRWMGKNLLDLY